MQILSKTKIRDSFKESDRNFKYDSVHGTLAAEYWSPRQTVFVIHPHWFIKGYRITFLLSEVNITTFHSWSMVSVENFISLTLSNNDHREIPHTVTWWAICGWGAHILPHPHLMLKHYVCTLYITQHFADRTGPTTRSGFRWQPPLAPFHLGLSTQVHWVN